MKPTKTISAKEFNLLDDPTRRSIIFLISSRELPVPKIAKEIDLSPPTIYHHIKKMLHAGLVEVSRTEQIGHLIESYYRPTAEVFISNEGEFYVNKFRVNTDKVLKGLNELGFKIAVDKKLTSDLSVLEKKRFAGVDIKELEQAIANLKDYNLPTLMHIKRYAILLLLSEAQFADTLMVTERIREILKSRCQLDKIHGHVKSAAISVKPVSKHDR